MPELELPQNRSELELITPEQVYLITFSNHILSDARLELPQNCMPELELPQNRLSLVVSDCFRPLLCCLVVSSFSFKVMPLINEMI